MKITSTHTKDVWASGDYAGNTRRPTMRATIAKLTAAHPQYRYEEERSKEFAHPGYFQSLFFGQENNRPRELVNIQSIKWSRGVDSDVGSCTIVLANVEVRNDAAPLSDAELDFPGYFTPNRGDGTYFDQWGYVKNEWSNWLIPDRIIRTYEGYGGDPTVAPEHDSYLYPSGVWLVDDVVLSAEGTITLECRDFGRVLLDQVMSPPAIPWGVYPLFWSQFEDRAKPQKVVAGAWQVPTYEKDSNLYYRGTGITDDDGTPIISADGTVFGHHGRDAFDPSTTSFWLSTGKRTRVRSDAYEYVQGKIPAGSSVEGVKLDSAINGRMRVYISLQRDDGTWVGRKRIPYKAINVDVAANVPYVHEFILKAGETITVKLRKKYTGISKIRYTFGHLPWTGYGYSLNFRAGIAKVYYANSVSLVTEPGAFKYGNYGDYTEIVKWLLAWAGWYWPNAEQELGTIRYSDDSTINMVPAADDPSLVNGRVWGDFELTGTKGITKLDVDMFDKKPFMDGIAAVREIVGFDFWIDETGGAVWRLPNVFKRGSYIMPIIGGARTTRTQTLVEINERTNLTDITAKLSSKNIRERVYVGNASGHKGAVVRGYYPDYTGLRRYAGWTDQRFASNAECERMADLIAIRQAFLYRQDTVTIAANPAIQPDDQIIITERTTGEGYIHRVLNIASEWNAETGQWTYALTTNWLGDRAFTSLAFDPQYMRNETKVYLRQMQRW